LFEMVMGRPQRRWSDRARARWRMLRAAFVALAIAVAFVDGLTMFLSPGAAVASAFGSSGPHGADPRFGVFLGLVFWASLAFVSTLMRARVPDPADVLARD
jgi:hypothetical protein